MPFLLPNVPASIEVAEVVPRRLHVWIETPTLRKLPQTGWIVFTIRTAIAPLSNWVDNIKALDHLQKLVSGLTPAMSQYRGAQRYEAKLTQWVISRQR